MSDYKEMYGKLYRAVQQSIVLLQKAQEECETMHMAKLDPEIDMSRFFFFFKENLEDNK